jgi:hypothetical protein
MIDCKISCSLINRRHIWLVKRMAGCKWIKLSFFIYLFDVPVIHANDSNSFSATLHKCSNPPIL